MFFKVLLIQLFLSVTICSRDAPRIRNRITSWNRTSEIAPHINTPKDKVQLKVYYETLCPASVDFFVSQLNPAVKRLGAHLEVHLIPYGHAKTFRSRGIYSFSCQHGPPECYGNMVHACAIDVLRNSTHAILFNSCLMQYTSYHGDYKYFVSVITWEYGDETHALAPRYVPYLMLDGSTERQDEAAGNLIATVCRLLSPKPLGCLTRR